MLDIKMCSEHASVMALWNGQSLCKLLILPPSFDNDLVNIFHFFFFLIAQKHPPEVFYKEGILKFNFPKFAGKHLCQSLFFNNAAVTQRFRYRCFQ